jgi:peptidyl-prolyl cis-trans isomerase SurA
MTKRKYLEQGTAITISTVVCLFALVLLAAPCAAAQTAAQRNATSKTKPEPKPEAPKMPTVEGTPIDRVVAIVNGDLVLDSDVDEEQRFQVLQPFPTPGNVAFTRDKAIERLINRDLILQQAKLQPDSAVADADVDKELTNLRKNLPACKEKHCETDAGWSSYLASNGFTPDLMRQRWKQRMQVLSFIEDRFRMGINISQADIKEYYEKTFVPEFARQNATAPKLDAVSERIQEVLLQQRVSTLLNDWLRSLRAQGGVIVLHPGEDAP